MINRRRQRGITVIEVALCIAAALGIAYVAVVASRTTRDRASSAELVEDVDTVVARVRDRYKTDWDYGAVSALGLDREGLIPPRLAMESAAAGRGFTSWLNSAYGRIDLEPFTIGGEAAAGFSLQFALNIPRDVCNDLVAYGVREAAQIYKAGVMHYTNTGTVTGSAAHPAVRTLVCDGGNQQVRLVFQ